MNRDLSIVVLGLFLGTSGAIAAGLSPERLKSLPPPADHKVDFIKEIKPIFEASCIKCHGRGKAKGGLSLENRGTLLKGGDSGAAIAPGKSGESYLVELVSGLNPDLVMPQKGSKLKPEQVGALRAWIDQGAPWDDNISFGKLPPVNLLPRKPELPAAHKGITNPIDRILQPYYEQHAVKLPKPVNDRVFARRVYFDVVGLLPTPEELAGFEADKRPDKREQLVKLLLADNRRYAEHWLTFWNDALRNDYRGTGYIDGGRKQITDWLYAALAKNMPFDQFVRELIDPTPESEGFAKGIVWRGVVNASQTPQMQAAQNISQVFMGVNLKCASCHDSFINDWTLADAYGLASIYADQPLELVRCDKPTGEVAKTKFIYPELGDIDPKASKSDRLKQLAGIITREQDARLTRTIVNRLWAKFMGRGLIEPTDEMDNPAWNQDLLDWLAADLAENGYDLKKTVERILTSQAYQLPALPLSEQVSKDFVFRGPVTRRLSAEQFLDALSLVTGVWNESPAAQIDFSVADPNLGKPTAQSKWIWKDAHAAEKTDAMTIYLRKRVNLQETPADAFVVVLCDNSFKLFINGKEAGSGNDYTKAKLINVRSHLVQGENFFAVEAVNDPGRPDDKSADQSNPAGFLLYARVRIPLTPPLSPSQGERVSAGQVRGDSKSGENVLELVSDNSWVWSAEKVDDWEKPAFAASDWKPAVELGDVGAAPWNMEKEFAAVLSSAALRGQVRAALVNNDPLMTALGRPNREQVITSRSSAATTLQALELTNGRTLAELLKRGAERVVQEMPKSSPDLVTGLYERALGRKPNRNELRIAEELVGTPAKKDGVEDLLWTMTMLPEFQLIY
jgi:mono/diheme cytochrome c family protein